jgi:O-antigen ligase
MPVYLRAWVFAMVLSLLGLAFLRRTFVPSVYTESQFVRMRNLWLVITSIAFLASNFWVYAALAYIVSLQATRKQSNPLALYVFLLFAVPPFSRLLPGPGPIVSIVPLYHERILTIAILLPLALKLFGESTSRPPGLRFADLSVLMLLGYQLLGGIFHYPFTGMLRHGIYLFFDFALVYYVASRALRTQQQLREVIGAFICACAILAIVAVFESFKSWWVYETLQAPFAARAAAYMTRGDFGLLRAKATFGHPITLGYNMGVAIVLLYTFSGQLASRAKQRVLVGLLVAGLIVSFSRGPWVGTAAGLLYLMFSGPGKVRRIMASLFLGSIAIGILSLTQFGRSLYSMLPFVGTVDSGSVVYRQNLWDVSIVVLKQHLWFGDMNYLLNPLMEQMRQGEGIIDMVNSYLQIALAYGIVGLMLFGLCLLCAWRGARPEGSGQTPRALRAALITICLTIATVSNIPLIPVTTWLVIGLCVGYGGLAALARREQEDERLRTNLATNEGSASLPDPAAEGGDGTPEAITNGPGQQGSKFHPPVVDV